MVICDEERHGGSDGGGISPYITNSIPAYMLKSSSRGERAKGSSPTKVRRSNLPWQLGFQLDYIDVRHLAASKREAEKKGGVQIYKKRKIIKKETRRGRV